MDEPTTKAARPALTNWAGNLSYSADRWHEPTSIDQIRSIVRSEQKVKVLGTGHSFNSIADSRGALMSLSPMQTVVALDADGHTVTVDGGITYEQLCPYLNSKGFALGNLASLPHISIAGACSTASHGSGEDSGNLATEVTAVEFVTSEGDLVKLSRKSDSEVFRGSIVGLGALGVVVRLTLDIQPTYAMRQLVYKNLPLEQMTQHFDEIQASAYSISLFTDWQEQRVKQVWVKSRAQDGRAFTAAPEFFGAKLADRHLHPLEELSAENCTEQLGVPGPWFERLPHFRIGLIPSTGNELQSEYFVPRRNAVDAILAVERLRDYIRPNLLISEIRTVAADDLWMSTSYGQPSVAIHFTWKKDWPSVRGLLPIIERELSPYSPRPHWGKLFTMPAAQLRARYDMLEEFCKLAKKYDPAGMFRNDFLKTYVFDEPY